MVKINREVVERLMFDKRMKQVQLIERSGISKPTIIRMLNGSPFDSVTLGKLARALECSPVDLIDPEGYPSPHLATQATDRQPALENRVASY